MRLPRMTTRRWMVAVAVIALAIATVRIRERSLTYRRKAAYHADVAMQGSRAGRFDDRRGVVLRNSGPGPFNAPSRPWQIIVILDPRQIDHHGKMARKYEQAARYPWLPVEPDSPEPE